MIRTFQIIVLIGWVFSCFVQDAHADRPYVIGGKNDPALRNEADNNSDKGTLDLRVELLRSHRYDSRYAASKVNIAPQSQAFTALGRLSQSGPVAWSVESGRRLQLPRVQGSPRQLAFDYGMRRLAVATAEGNAGEGGVSLYDLDTGELLQELRAPSEAQDLAFSPDGKVIVAATRAGVFAWDLAQRRAPALPLTEAASDSVIFSSANRLLIAGQEGALLQIFSFTKGQVVLAPSGQDGGPSAWSPDGRYLAIARRASLRIVALEEGLELDLPSERELVSVDWGASGDLIVVGTADGEVLTYRVEGVPSAQSEGATRLQTGAREQPRDVQNDTRSRPVRRGVHTKRAPPPEKEQDVTIEAAYEVQILERFDADPREGRDLERRLRERERKLESCWNKELRQGKPATGRLEVTMDVTPDGEGRGFDEIVQDELGNGRLTECIEDKLRSALFPPGLDNLSIQLAIELKEVTAP